MDLETLLYADNTYLRKLCDKYGIDTTIYIPSFDNTKYISACLDDKITMCEKLLNIIPRTSTYYNKKSVFYNGYTKPAINEYSPILYNEFKSVNINVFNIMKELKIPFGQTIFYIVRQYWSNHLSINYLELKNVYRSYLKDPPKRMQYGSYRNYVMKTYNITAPQWELQKENAMLKINNYYNNIDNNLNNKLNTN
jgi:hypothetical protein